MTITTGTNRFVIIGKKYVYKLPIGKRGILANEAEYENAKDNPGCAVTEKHWYGLRQEKLYEIFALPYCMKTLEILPEWEELWKKKLHNRFQIGMDRRGKWKFFDYEDVKYKNSKEK